MRLGRVSNPPSQLYVVENEQTYESVLCSVQNVKVTTASSGRLTKQKTHHNFTVDHENREIPRLPDVASAPSVVVTINDGGIHVETPRTNESNIRLAHEHTRYIPSNLLDLAETCDPLETETNMKTMDRLYNASFHEYIKCEENVMTIARHLMSILKDFNVQTVANGLRWIINGWQLEAIAKLLKLTTRDWLPDVCGLLMNLITAGWIVEETDPIFGDDEESKNHARNSKITYPPEHLNNFVAQIPQLLSIGTATKISRASSNALMKLMAILVSGEQADTVATFVKALTSADNWTPERVTELVSFLDAVLEWDEEFFREFTKQYMLLIAEDEALEKRKHSAHLNLNPRKATGKLSFEYLASLYKTNLALANYRLAVADFKLALASRNLNSERILHARQADSLGPERVQSPIISINREQLRIAAEAMRQSYTTATDAYASAERTATEQFRGLFLHEDDESGSVTQGTETRLPGLITSSFTGNLVDPTLSRVLTDDMMRQILAEEGLLLDEDNDILSTSDFLGTNSNSDNLLSPQVPELSMDMTASAILAQLMRWTQTADRIETLEDEENKDEHCNVSIVQQHEDNTESAVKNSNESTNSKSNPSI